MKYWKFASSGSHCSSKGPLVKKRSKKKVGEIKKREKSASHLDGFVVSLDAVGGGDQGLGFTGPGVCQS